MGTIVFICICILVSLFMIIYSIYKHEELWVTIFFVFFAIACSVGLFFAIKDYKYGEYKELVTVYGMEHKGIDTNGTYTKNNLTFTNKEFNSSFTDIFEVSDSGDIDLNLHSYIINLLFDFKEGTFQHIYSHLKDYADHFEKSSEITIYNNHLKLTIEYYSISKSIEYTIIREKAYKEDEDSDGNTIKVDNYYYDKNYVVPELKIEHYNNDYYDFDKELCLLLFDKDIEKAKKTESNINGVYHISYCFGTSCLNNK